MLTKRIFICVLFVSILIGNTVKAQDAEFSQFYSSPLYLNPALAGTGECARIIMNYRDQWPSLSRTYITYDITYDQYFPKIRSGLGLIMFGDRAGNSTVLTHGASLVYALRVPLSPKFNLQFGLQASLFEKRVDWDKLIFGDQLDPRFGLVVGKQTLEPVPSDPSVIYADFSTGMVGYSERFFGGVAIQHLTEPDESLLGDAYVSKLPMRTTIHVGTIFYIIKRIEGSTFIAPDLLYTTQGAFKQLNFGLYWSNSMFHTGGRYRHSFGNPGNPDALIPFFGYRNESFKISYSYDITISKLGVGNSAGAHEIAMEMRFCPKVRRIETLCPRW